MTPLALTQRSMRSFAFSTITGRDSKSFDHSTTQDFEIESSTRCRSRKCVEQIIRSRESLSICLDKQIAEQQPTLFCRRVVGDRNHQQAAFAGDLLLLGQRGRKSDRLYCDANERSSHMTTLEQLVDYAVNSLRGQGEGSAAGQCGVVDGEHRTAGVDEWTSGEAIVDSEVEPQHPVDTCTLPRAPAFAYSADNAEARRDVFARPTDRQHQRANAE